METPEVEAHAHHRTGIGWLDASLALSAFAVSIISLFVAIHHGSTMKEMAEANAKMVQASVWPFVELSHSNNSNGTQIISMDVANQGIGPARIEKFQVVYKDKPMKSTFELLNACCFIQASDLESVFGDHLAPIQMIMTNEIEGRILPAHSGGLLFLGLQRTAKNAAVWDRLNAERFKMRFQICYCSVFDECWTSSKTGDKATKATPVKECPADWISYSQ